MLVLSWYKRFPFFLHHLSATKVLSPQDRKILSGNLPGNSIVLKLIILANNTHFFRLNPYHTTSFFWGSEEWPVVCWSFAAVCWSVLVRLGYGSFNNYPCFYFTFSRPVTAYLFQLPGSHGCTSRVFSGVRGRWSTRVCPSSSILFFRLHFQGL